MIPPTCFSCYELLADKQIFYEKELEKICHNNEKGVYKTKEELNNAKIDLINKLKLKRYCCKQIFVTYVDLIKLIK